jgi:septal ring factor EnvC (AmiA/AmiB activator)
MSRLMKSIGLLATAGALVVGVGCGKNEPCNTDPAQVDSARSALESAQSDLASAKSELANAEARKQSLQQQMNSLEDANELRERLDILKKGSGR